MKHEYEVTLEDLVDFNMYHAANSPTVKRSMVRQRFLGPVLFLLMPFVFRLLDPDSFKFFMTYFLVFSVLWIIFYPRFFKGRIKKSVTKILKEGDNRGLVGRQTIFLSDEGIIEINETKESKYKWFTIQKIDTTTNNILIFNSSSSAIIIPIRSFAGKEKLEEFLQVVRNYHQAHKE